MRLLTLLLAALVAGLAFLWGGEAGSDDPLLPTAPVAATPDAPRGRPDGLPEEQLEDREVPAAGPAVARREAVAPASVDLDLRLVHAVDGSPLEPGDASIQVWQLGLAADEEWTAGDRKVFDGPVTAGQVLLRDLAPGRYRAFVWDARLGSTVPPAFDLAPRPDGTAVVVTWPVEPAVAEPIWLVVVDEAGEPVEPVLRRNRNSWRLRTHGGMAPDWARERRKRDELGHAVGHDHRGGEGGRGRQHEDAGGRGVFDKQHSAGVRADAGGHHPQAVGSHRGAARGVAAGAAGLEDVGGTARSGPHQEAPKRQGRDRQDGVPRGIVSDVPSA